MGLFPRQKADLDNPTQHLDGKQKPAGCALGILSPADNVALSISAFPFLFLHFHPPLFWLFLPPLFLVSHGSTRC